MSKVWLIASGKGGVGKSTAAAALGLALARSGRETCVVDADIGLRDQDAILGLENAVVYDLLDVARKGCALEQALITLPGEPRFQLLAASQFARCKDLTAKAFEKIIARLREKYAFILIDCPAGIERGLRNLLGCGADGALLVTTPDAVCLRDAERASQLLREKGVEEIRLLVNRVNPLLVERGETLSAAQAAAQLELPLAGEIPEDLNVYRAALNRLSVLDVPCEAREAYLRTARRLGGEEIAFPAYGTKKRSLWRRLLRPALKEMKPID